MCRAQSLKIRPPARFTTLVEKTLWLKKVYFEIKKLFLQTRLRSILLENAFSIQSFFSTRVIGKNRVSHRPIGPVLEAQWKMSRNAAHRSARARISHGKAKKRKGKERHGALAFSPGTVHRDAIRNRAATAIVVCRAEPSRAVASFCREIAPSHTAPCASSAPNEPRSSLIIALLINFRHPAEVKIGPSIIGAGGPRAHPTLTCWLVVSSRSIAPPRLGSDGHRNRVSQYSPRLS